MASPQIKATRRGEQKPPMADRVSNKKRVSKANGSSRTLRKSFQPESTPNRSKAFDARSSYQTSYDKHRALMTRRSTPDTTRELNSIPNLSLRVKIKDHAKAEDEGVLPVQRAISLPPGSQSSMPRLNMSDMPAEVLQLIWGEVINTPACHTFKIKSVDRADRPKKVTKWTVDLWAKDGSDSSAYLRWKQLFRLENIGFQMAFRRFVHHPQPIILKGLTDKYKPCTKTAAIDEAQDLVILEMHRGQILPWVQHSHSYSTAMDAELVQERFRHFRRVAIHYKSGQMDFAGGGAFLCLCEDAARRHGDYHACPLTLACFLDVFPNLENFYFVVETKLVWHKKFATEYRDEVASNGFRARIDAPGGAKAIGKQFTLSRFFDTKNEYLQQAPYAYLEAMGRTGSADTFKDRTDKPPSPWIGDASAQQCLVETQQYFKSQKGTEVFLQDLEKRKNVRFGVLITYPLQDPRKKDTT